MRLVYLGNRPPPACDVCPNPKQPARFNSPTRRDSVGGGRWANMCDRHMDSMGVMTSVTEKFVTGEKPSRDNPSLRQHKIEAAKRNARMFGTDPSWYGLTPEDIR